MVEEITTGNGTYVVKIPGGRYGARHFYLLKRASPKNFDEQGKAIRTSEEEDTAQQCFELWCSSILPNIIDQYPDGISGFETMPGEDQYAIWNAMFDLANVGTADGALFRIKGRNGLRSAGTDRHESGDDGVSISREAEQSPGVE